MDNTWGLGVGFADKVLREI